MDCLCEASQAARNRQQKLEGSLRGAGDGGRACRGPGLPQAPRSGRTADTGCHEAQAATPGTARGSARGGIAMVFNSTFHSWNKNTPTGRAACQAGGAGYQPWPGVAAASQRCTPGPSAARIRTGTASRAGSPSRPAVPELRVRWRPWRARVERLILDECDIGTRWNRGCKSLRESASQVVQTLLGWTHAALGSGWWPALAAPGFAPAGSRRRFPSCLLAWLICHPPSPRFVCPRTR